MQASNASLAGIIEFAQTVGFYETANSTPGRTQFGERRKLAIIATELAQASTRLYLSNAIYQFQRRLSATLG